MTNRVVCLKTIVVSSLPAHPDTMRRLIFCENMIEVWGLKQTILLETLINKRYIEAGYTPNELYEEMKIRKQ